MPQIISIVAILALLAFWVWMFNDMTRNTYLTREARFNWMVAFIFLNVFGAAFYYFNVYKNMH